MSPKVPEKPTHTHLLDEARDAARAYQAMCAVYRIGGRPTEALFKRLEKAHAAIDRWNEAEKAGAR
jgi:hypothetical protein